MLLSVHLAYDSLKQHKARSLLAASGVMLGVFLVSLILIIGDSAKASLNQQLSDLPSQSVIASGNNGDGSSLIHKPASTLSNKDIEAVSEADEDLNLSSSLLINSDTRIDDRTFDDVNVVATSTNYYKTLNLKMRSGSWFSAEDSDKNWVILGYDLAHQLIGTESPQNEVVTIRGRKFTVVGIVDKVHQPIPIMGYDINQSAFISLSNGQEITKSSQISQIIATGSDDVDKTRKVVATALGHHHADSGEYRITTTADLSKQLSHSISTVSLVALTFAGVILLISIIAIANVMLVTVTERRREIGIRKAVGATTRNILNQFLAESLIISLRGGITGLVVAYIVAFVVTFLMSFSLAFSWLAILIGFLLPVAIGVIAGVYPAYRAARGDIITALRQLT